MAVLVVVDRLVSNTQRTFDRSKESVRVLLQKVKHRALLASKWRKVPMSSSCMADSSSCASSSTSICSVVPPHMFMRGRRLFQRSHHLFPEILTPFRSAAADVPVNCARATDCFPASPWTHPAGSACPSRPTRRLPTSHVRPPVDQDPIWMPPTAGSATPTNTAPRPDPSRGVGSSRAT